VDYLLTSLACPVVGVGQICAVVSCGVQKELLEFLHVQTIVNALYRLIAVERSDLHVVVGAGEQANKPLQIMRHKPSPLSLESQTISFTVS
jgi:hypothetical protein